MASRPGGNTIGPERVLIVPPCPACVSRSYSSATRSRSASCPFGWISISQSIATPLSAGQQGADGVRVAGRQRRFELGNLPLKLRQRLDQCLPVLQEDAGPQRRVAGRDARGVAEA